jgi:hypothetical protein
MMSLGSSSRKISPMFSKRRFSMKSTLQIKGLVRPRGMSYEKRDINGTPRQRKRARDDDLLVYVAGLIENASDPELARSAYAAFQAIVANHQKKDLPKELTNGLIRALRVFANRTQRVLKSMQRENEIGEKVDRVYKQQHLSLRPPYSRRAETLHENAHSVVASQEDLSARTVYKMWLRYESRKRHGADLQIEPSARSSKAWWSSYVFSKRIRGAL